MAVADKYDNVDVQQGINPTIFLLRSHAKDMEFVMNQGLKVDDENEPAPEKIFLTTNIQMM